MGLFSTQHKVYVSSVAYNMAGDVGGRLNYLKTLSITSVLGSLNSTSTDVVTGYLKGPGMNQRSFYRWSKDYFPLGTCEGLVSQAVDVPSGPLASEIPMGSGESISVQSAFVDMGDIAYWGERWMLENRPLEYADDWVADFDTGTGELVVTFPVGPEEREFHPTFSSTKKYIFAYYTRTLADTPEVQSLFIYELGSGNVDLDALDVEVNLAPEIFPVIPLRLNNVSIGEPAFSADYPSYSKAYQKATGGQLADLLASIEDEDINPNIGDIDFAFLVHGVELNTEENCGKQYLYEFFKSQIPHQKTTPLELTNWLFLSSGYTSAQAALAAWNAAQLDPLDPLYGTPKPTVPQRSNLEVTRFEVRTPSSLNYRTNLGWVTIDENLYTGLGKLGARKGDLWTELVADTVFPPVLVSNGSGPVGAVGTVGHFRLFWQNSDTGYKVLDIYGMFHENFVYSGKMVLITAREALESADISGFVVPLHYPTLVGMPLVLSTQLALSNRIIVFNCYQVVSVRWYETGLFKLLITVVVAVVVAVFVPGATGLLGSALSVGVSLGFAGITAIVVGAIANTLAAMILMTIIQKGAVALFGDQLGAIVGAIASMFAVSYVSSLNSGMPFTFDFNLGDITKAENLLKLTNALSNIADVWSQVETTGIQSRIVDAFADYQKASEDIESKQLAEIGYGALALNPLMFTNTDGSFSSEQKQDFSRMTQPESPSTFLTRTLMTGTDIVRMSLAMVREYPAISLELPKPFT